MRPDAERLLAWAFLSWVLLVSGAFLRDAAGHFVVKLAELGLWSP